MGPIRGDARARIIAEAARPRHGPDGERLVRFDNAHRIERQRRGEPHDHRHRLRTVEADDCRDAATLLSDFRAAVDAVLRERGVIP